MCHPSQPQAIPGVNRFSPEPKVRRSFTPLCYASPELGVSCVAQSLGAESWSRSRSRSWSQSREDTDKAKELESAAAVAPEVAAMVGLSGSRPSNTYPAGAHLGRERTEESRANPGLSRSGAGLAAAP